MSRTERFALVMTKYEKWLIEKLAELEGDLSHAALLRRLIHKAANEHQLQNISIPEKKAKDKNNDR